MEFGICREIQKSTMLECSLCVGVCHNYKFIYDKNNGKRTEAYDIVAKFFDEKVHTHKYMHA